MTQNEKKQLFEIIYDYRISGTRLTANEITRIAINYLVYDYKEKKKKSILSRVINSIERSEPEELWLVLKKAVA